ncbi:hypothetical protein ACJMK2_014236 [Sinanodonta woodiana]|uniref:Glycosyltransferase n=1 Tax=Sinanodonta woodiana TaxID=1069815 RepID=A0ABD3V027_SINWO
MRHRWLVYTMILTMVFVIWICLSGNFESHSDNNCDVIWKIFSKYKSIFRDRYNENNGSKILNAKPIPAELSPFDIGKVSSHVSGSVMHEMKTPCCVHEFCMDNTPPNQRKYRMGGPIHFCIAAGNADVVMELEPLVKTLLLHARRADVFLHILTGNGSDKAIKTMLSNIPDSHVKFTYELLSLNTDRIYDLALHIHVNITHHSGVWGMSKLYMYEIFNDVDKCIVIDTDIVFGTDPEFLWDFFLDQEEQQVISMRITKDMTESRMSNSGLMLQDFKRMRRIHFSKFYLGGVELVCRVLSVCSDQDVLFGVFKNNGSYLFSTIPESWNLELCHDFGGFSFDRYADPHGRFFGGAHFNCARAENKALQHFTASHSARNLRDYVEYLISMPIQAVC